MMKLIIFLLSLLVLSNGWTSAIRNGRNNLKVTDIDHYSQGIPLFSIAAKNARFINSERTWAKKFRFTPHTIAAINGNNNLKATYIDRYVHGEPLYIIAAENNRFTNSDRTWAKKFRFSTRERRSNEASHIGNNLLTGTFDGTIKFSIFI